MEKRINFAENINGTRLLRTEKGAIGIRQYSPSDFEGFYALYAKTFAEPPWNEKWTREAVKEELDDYAKQSCLDFLIAAVLPPAGSRSQATQIVGISIAYLVEPNTGFFPARLKKFLKSIRVPLIYGDELAVDISFRGMGVGTMLMESRFETFKSLFPAGCMFVGRTNINSRMVSLYGRLEYDNTGFEDSKYQSRYYFIKSQPKGSEA